MDLYTVFADHLLKTKKEWKNLRDIYQNKRLDKACVQHDMAYEDFKDLARRTPPNKALQDKSYYNIAKNSKYDGSQLGLAATVYKFCGKKSSSDALHMQINLLLKANSFQTNNWLKNYTNQILENLKNEKFNHLLKTIFGVLIFWICI